MPKEQTVFGYALTLKKLKKTKEFLEIVNRYDGLFPSVIGLLFPDDNYHPPTPCDLKLDPSLSRQVQSAPFNVRAPGVPVAVAYGTYPMGYGGVPRPINQATIPLPQNAVSPLQRVKIDPKEFPISVTAENPLRFGMPSIPRSEAVASLAPPQASISPLIQEPPLGTPLVARR